MVQLDKFKSLLEVFQAFSENEKCIDYLKKLRWSKGIECPHCNHTKIYEFKDGKRYKCAKCEKQFTVLVGTIFENTKISLSKWFAAIYLLTSHKKGISSMQLGRDIGVTQKTAWFMLQRIRQSLKKEHSSMIETIAEIDETYIGGKEKSKHKNKRQTGTQGRSTKTKTPILGIMERNGKVRTVKLKSTSASAIHPFVLSNIFPSTKIVTDEWSGYRGLNKIYDHSVVRHSREEYVVGINHTNTIEGFWSLLKRGIIGIYHYASEKHIEKYVDEFAFRYNSYKMSDCDRFYMALGQVKGRLKYKDLIKN